MSEPLRAGSSAPADEPEIEITPAMMEAGVRALALCESTDSWWSTAEAVYRAMEVVRLSRAFKMSSIIPMGISPLHVLATVNGEIQLACSEGEAPFGLMVGRGQLRVGTLLTSAQARQLARLLLNGVNGPTNPIA